MATTATVTPVTDDVLDALSAAVIEINDMFTAAYDWTGKGESPTGERFRDMLEGPHKDAEIAIEQLGIWFSYCAKHSPNASIYWKIQPEINHHSGKRNGYLIYCRYLISDKPKRD